MNEISIQLSKTNRNVNIKKDRNLNLDTLRIFACFMVVFLHVTAKYCYMVPIQSFNWKICSFYDACVRSAVPLFVMISGVFFLSPDKEITTKKIYSKYIFKLVIIYLAWSVIYTIYDIYLGTTSFDIRSIILSIIRGPYHFWYISMIVGLYIISPILRKITKKIDKKEIRYFSIIFAIACTVKTISCLSILPYSNAIKLICTKLPIDFICQYYSYFLLGYFLFNFDISKYKKRIIYISGCVSPILCAILTFCLSTHDGNIDISLFDNFSIFTLLEAIAIFVFFKSNKYKVKSLARKMILELSKLTLGIYLIHILILEIIFSIIDLSNYNSLFAVPIVSIIIFLLSISIIFILRKIIVLKKLV